MTGDDFALTAGWGHYGTGDAVMPGQGRIVERDYTADERAALGDAISVLGQTTFDIYLNGNAYWRNVPGCGLALQAGRLSGAQEMAVVSGTSCPPPPAQARGNPALLPTRQVRYSRGWLGVSGRGVAHDKKQGNMKTSMVSEHFTKTCRVVCGGPDRGAPCACRFFCLAFLGLAA